MRPSTPLEPTDRILLVGLPGTLCDGRAFDPLIGALRARGMLVRGLGIDTAAATTAGEVARLAQAEIAPERDEVLVIAGFSLGGIIASHLTRRLRDQVGALVLLDMNGEADRPDNAATRRAMVERARQNGLDRFILDETWPTHVAACHLGDTALRDAVVDMAQSVGLDGFARQTEIAISRARSIDILSGLGVPTRVFVGAEDRITPRPLAADIAAATGGDLVSIPEAGHFALLERPDAIADSMVEWLFHTGQGDRQRQTAASRQT